MTTERNSALPGAERRLLLRAALLDGDTGREAYAEWRRHHDPTDLEPVSYRLLPLLYRNLERLGVEAPERARLQGVYRHAWYANQRLLHAAGPGLRLLAGAGIPVVLLKGAALVATSTGGDVGVRPMEDVDVLVPAADAVRAHDALVAGGWHWYEPEPPEDARRRKQSSPYVPESGTQLDLHWRPLWEPGSTGTLWEAVVPATLAGAEVLVPSRAHQLVVTAAHGVGWHPSPLRWIADCALLLRGIDEAGWDELVAAARAARMGGTVAAALDVVGDVLDLELPAGTMQALRSQRGGPVERVALGSKVRGPGPGAGYLASLEYAVRSRRADDTGRIGAVEHLLLCDGGTRREIAARLVRRTGELAGARLRRS
ncbi:putative nucleotidyltransferase-like protein [Motilibacter rhizosphaerae]|uniref:Putative nucleotidyltransferase-like protein n=1 Tax=Motilibacter rhizosphaerae TaxID=598652 RepID=A0A4Q7NVY5_9ACTN|nr:nucleotidyltransferase family protein [Motilibacter rhizosphaerae]RZS91443.1 putative nucleotidyltransferase-like protein [Motilibacter rhizosphaerae]